MPEGKNPLKKDLIKNPLSLYFSGYILRPAHSNADFKNRDKTSPEFPKKSSRLLKLKQGAKKILIMLQKH
jgi:hypothetical protein